MSKEILEIIAKKPGITYTDLIYEVKDSASGLWIILRQLEKEGKIKSKPLPNRKAKGWIRV